MLGREGLLRDVERHLERGLGDGGIGRAELARVETTSQEARTGKKPFLATSVAQEIERVFMRGSGREARRDPAGDAPRRLNFR